MDESEISMLLKMSKKLVSEYISLINELNDKKDKEIIDYDDI